MQKHRFEITKKSKKILSMALATVVVVTSIPAIEFFREAENVGAAVTYSPKKIGVSLMCKDMLSGSNPDNVYKALTRTKSQKEDSENGSAFNNVGMVGLTYQNRHGDAGKSYRVKLNSGNYTGLYDLAKKKQIEQSISANVKNHNHRSTKRHWNKIKQYSKIIFGYPKAANDDWWYLGKLYETEDNDDYSTIGGNDSWSTMYPDKGYNKQLGVYLTAKKGCDGCSGAYIENVSIAFKDTKSPTISSIKIMSTPAGNSETKYFKAGQTMYVHVKFSEYVRLADNDKSSSQSSNIKLGLSLASNAKKDATTIYADLMSLKDDVAVFSYTVPEEIEVGDKKMNTDFFVSGLANIDKQSSLVVLSSAKKGAKFNRAFLDNNGNTLSGSSNTMKKLKGGVNDNTRYEENIIRTTCAITDIAGNPVDISSFRVDQQKGVEISRTYLDAVNPKVQKVLLSTNQTQNQYNDNENHYIKAGKDISTKVVFSENLKKLSNQELAQISAKFNVYDSSGNQVTAKATNISYGDNTTITFEPIKIEKGMKIKLSDADSATANTKSDYKITIKDIENIKLLKDYSDNQLANISDLRSDTSYDYYLDNEAPVIKIDNENVDESKTYEMARCNTSGEVYRAVLNTTDVDTVSGSKIQPFASGVLAGQGSISVDLQSDTVSKFQYILSNESISDKKLSDMSFNIGKSKSALSMYGKDGTTFTLSSNTSYVYLYVKFDEDIDYGDVKSGIKVKMTSTDINGNSKSVTAKYNYEPKDKVKPNIYFESINLKENNDNTAYQEVKVRLTDKGGIDINNIKYVWVEQGNSVPQIGSYKLLPAENVEKVKTENNKVTECIATIKTNNIALNQTYNADLYVYTTDLSGNETSSDKLATAEIDMSMPTLQIAVPESKTGKKSSLIVNGPFTSSDNEVSMFVAIEDPINRGCYFVRKQSGKASQIASKQEEYLNENILPFSNNADENELSKWSYGKISKNGNIYTITNTLSLINNTDKSFRDRFLAIASNMYYGKVNVIAGTGFNSSAFTEEISGTKFDKTKGSFIEKSFIMLPDTYGFSTKQDVVANNFNVYDTKPNNIKITAKGNYGKQVNKEDYENYNPEDNKPEFLSTLSGAGFNINITNQRTNDFVTDDINYQSANTYIKLKNVDTGKYVYQWDFDQNMSSEDITMPDDIILENGHYAVEASVANYTEGNAKEIVSTYTYDDIYLYDYSDKMTEGFGVDSVSTKIEFEAEDEHQYDERPAYVGFVKTGRYVFSRKFVDERTKDYSVNSSEAYDTNTLFLGNCGSYENDNLNISYDRTIKFAVNGMSAEDLDNYWIKIWTGDSSNEQYAKWFKFEKFDDAEKIMTINVKPIDGIKEKNVNTPEEFYGSDIGATECQIPVFEGSNTVSYEIMNIGGNKSLIHQMEINYHKEAPTLNIDVDKSDEIVNTMEARVIEIGSNLVTKDVDLYETDFKGEEALIEPISDRKFEYSANGRHLYYAVDGYRNLTYKQFYIENIDNKAPVASFKTVSPAKYEIYDETENDGYMTNATLEVDIKDDKPLINSQIQVSVDGKEPFIVDSDDKWDMGDGYAGAYLSREKLQGTGIKNIQVSFGPETDGQYYASLYIEMNDDIDSTKAFKEKIEHKVSVSVVDQAGHEMEKELTTDGQEFYGLNNVPKVKRVICDSGYDVNIEFTGNVRVTKVNGNEVPEKLYENMDLMDRFFIARGEDMERYFEGVNLEGIKLKDFFGISKDGTYDIEYVDAYNNKYKESIKIEDFFGNYAADINYSILSKTNQNVVATITGVDKNAQLSLKEEKENSDNYTVSWNKDKSKATIEFSANDSVTFELKVKGAAQEDKTVEYNVTVGNIDKTAPNDVQVTWVFKETGEIVKGNTLDIKELLSLTTNNDIEVNISSESEDLYGINGKELKHVFTYSENMERSYTFEYADECGNEGEPLTVTLPDELVMTEYEKPIPEEEIPDKEAPLVSAEVYGVYDGMAEYKTSWSPETDDFSEIETEIGYTGGYKIKYTLLDASKAKIIVLNGTNLGDNVNYNSSSDKIDGIKVTETDNTIVITKKCSITVVAVDEEGNKVAHSFSVSRIDTEKPTVTVKKVGKSFTEMKLQFYGDDNTDEKNVNGTITPVTKGLKTGVDADGYYYYMDVKDNGTYNTVFKDRSGNKTTVTTKITEIDNKAATIKVSSWSPCYTKDGVAYEKIAPTEPVNSSVTLSLNFDKTVSELKVFYQKGDSWIEDKNTFSKTFIELGGRKGKVEFYDTVLGIVKIVATSPNGMSSELTDIDLEGIIDKNAPKITFTQTKKRNSVEVIYKSDEKVLVTGCDYDITYGAGTNIPLTIKKNGTYDLTFTDMAGNITTKSITVDSIDETPPEIYAVGIPEDYVSSENCKIKVTMSEKGTITFQGKDYSVNGPNDTNGDGKYTGSELDWISLPISTNGNYQVKATDEAGLVSYKLLQVKYVDSQAPNIQFDQSVIRVSQGTTVKELKEILLDDTTFVLWDDIDPAPTVSIDNMLSDDSLNKQGIYQVEYILKDSVGNKRIITRYIKVISSANLKVKANGQLMSSCDTTILNKDSATITLEKSKRIGESFKVYYKQGIRKAGSMKNAKVAKNGKINNLEEGFYTLYIVTQNKETFLTYLFR